MDDVGFTAALLDDLAARTPIDARRVYATGLSNGAMPVLHIHSVDDPRALYEGGLGPPFPMTNTRVRHPAANSTT